MDILRKELEEIYKSQNLDSELLPSRELEFSKQLARNIVKVSMGCSVITDAAADNCYVYSGFLGQILGFSEYSPSFFTAESSDEDIIYNLIHPEDLVDKRLLEYEFFRLIDKELPDNKKSYVAHCLIRIKNSAGCYLRIANTTQVVTLSPTGKIWLILCTYSIAPHDVESIGISPTIVSTKSGQKVFLNFGSKRNKILTEREKEILKLISNGKLSKQIADILGISINTVNRHRQNILEKLSVGNSVEAVTAANMMNLL